MLQITTTNDSVELLICLSDSMTRDRAIITLEKPRVKRTTLPSQNMLCTVRRNIVQSWGKSSCFFAKAIASFLVKNIGGSRFRSFEEYTKIGLPDVSCTNIERTVRTGQSWKNIDKIVFVIEKAYEYLDYISNDKNILS